MINLGGMEGVDDGAAAVVPEHDELDKPSNEPSSTSCSTVQDALPSDAELEAAHDAAGHGASSEDAAGLSQQLHEPREPATTTPSEQHELTQRMQDDQVTDVPEQHEQESDVQQHQNLQQQGDTQQEDGQQQDKLQQQQANQQVDHVQQQEEDVQQDNNMQQQEQSTQQQQDPTQALTDTELGQQDQPQQASRQASHSSMQARSSITSRSSGSKRANVSTDAVAAAAPAARDSSLQHILSTSASKCANLHMLDDQTLAMAAGCAVLLLHLPTMQQHFLPSRDGGGVAAVAVHPDRKLFLVAEKCRSRAPNM